MFARAQAAAGYARRVGCGIDEATEAVAAGAALAGAGEGDTGRRDLISRRSVLGGAGAVALAAAVPLAGRARAAASSGHRPRVVIVGAGLAGLGCAYRLWHRHGIRSEMYEYNAHRIGGRVETLRGFFDVGQYAEQHGEFISSEHTKLRRLAASFGLTLDDVNRYPPHTRPLDFRLRFGGHFWPQAALDREWHGWARRLFLNAANTAGWPALYNHHTAAARRWDHMPASAWIDKHIPGGLKSDFGRLCVAVLLDEYGGAVGEQSALNLIYLLGFYDSSASGLQPKQYPQLSGTDEKWHIRGGNDQVTSGLAHRLPNGCVRLGERLVALRRRGNGRFTATFDSGCGTHDVHADHVVLALPFTKLREVELAGLDLPPRQLRAIHHEPLGPNTKIQLQFSRRVWNADHWTGNLYTDEIVQGGWDTTVDQHGRHGILVALPGGAEGAGIGRRYGLTSYHGPVPAAMARDFLRCFEVSFPGVSAAYTGKGYYAWSSADPHAGGAYSYFKPGQYTGFNGIQGRRRGNLHFAGEHTSVNFQGYMEGALRSGYRCASEIVAG
jgi:monoamine oxidase